MNMDQLIKAAYDRAQVEQIPSESFREGLAVLLEDINASSKVTEQGLTILEEEIIGYLVSRLQVDDHVRQHPELLEVPIEKPVVVLGMPRSGTTLLSYLLAADPARRSILRWQLSNPVPPAPADRLYDDPRCLAMKEADAQSVATSRKDLHYEPADGATECVFAQAQEFKSTYWESHVSMPNYSRFMLECDMTSAYEYHKRFLQVLQNGEAASWNLKMPSHALHIRWLLKTYPDARILWTHRDPYKVTGSLCSLISNAHNVYMGAPDIEFLASNYPVQLAEHVRRPMAVKDELGEDRIGDVSYASLTAKPIDEMRRIYRYLGDDFTPEAESGMRAWLEENPQGKFGSHKYTLEQFGLSKKTLEPYYADYLARFDIETEG